MSVCVCFRGTGPQVGGPPQGGGGVGWAPGHSGLLGGGAAQLTTGPMALQKEVIQALPKLIKLNPIVVKEVFNRLLGTQHGRRALCLALGAGRPKRGETYS